MAGKKFRYRLEKVLEFKIAKEDEEKEKLAKLIELEAHEREVKAQLEQLLVQIQVELREKQKQGILNLEELRWYPQYIKNTKDKIAYQELRLQEIAIRIIEQRRALLKAAQERKVYEKHKEKCQEEWLKEVEAEEARLIDELATIKFAREFLTKAEEERKRKGR